MVTLCRGRCNTRTLLNLIFSPSVYNVDPHLYSTNSTTWKRLGRCDNVERSRVPNYMDSNLAFIGRDLHGCPLLPSVSRWCLLRASCCHTIRFSFNVHSYFRIFLRYFKQRYTAGNSQNYISYRKKNRGKNSLHA